MSGTSIPSELDEILTAEWLNEALRTRYPTVRITDVIPGPVVSRISTNARFHLEGDLPPELATDLCVKGYFSDEGRVAQFVGVSEVGFYRDLAADTGVRTLTAVYAAVDESTNANVVITEDVLSQGATFLEPGDAYTVDQVAESLGELARLHAATWMRADAAAHSWLAPRLESLRYPHVMETIESNYATDVGAGMPASIRDPERMWRVHGELATEMAASPTWSVIHGDAHVGNLFVDRAGRPGLVDWQLVQRGPWFLDVGYHVASTLSVEDRRANEADLVAHYLKRLTSAGVPAPADSEVVDGLRKGIVHGLYLWSITRKVDRPTITELLTRLATAADDRGAFEARQR